MICRGGVCELEAIPDPDINPPTTEEPPIIEPTPAPSLPEEPELLWDRILKFFFP